MVLFMKTFFAVLFLGFLLAGTDAHAIKITNLDSVPHRMVINNAGEIREITIAPGASYFTFGPMVDMAVSRNGPSQRARWNGDYAIWPGGRLYLQNIRENNRR